MTRRSAAFRALALLIAWCAGGQMVRAQETLTTLPSIPTTADTAEKPQSKAWFHGHTWWTVLATNSPVPGGAWLCRLEPDGTWAFVLRIASNAGTKADTKIVGDVAHVLLKNSNSSLVSLEYVPALNTYQLWSQRPTPTPLYIGETGTIDVDSTNRMWLSTESLVNGIEIYYSDYPYASFTGPILLAPGIGSDDIGAVTALPNNTIGVIWSDRVTKRFGFRVHVDGTDPAVWLANEVPASQSARDDNSGMSDDHVHLAVAHDGTVYAAVKTRYPDGLDLPLTALLVRRPDPGGPGGTWDDMYFVDNRGTRPIVVFNEDTNTIRVFYTVGDGIVFRESPASSISFGPVQTVMSGGFNNVTSSKAPWSGRLLVLATNPAGATGVVMTTHPGLVGYWKTDEGGGTQLRDMSGWGNNADVVGSPTWAPGVTGLALNLDGSANAAVSDQSGLAVTNGLTLSAWIKPTAQTEQSLISRAITGSVDGYELGLSSSASASPRTVFLRFNQATSGDIYRLNSASQYPAGGHTWMHVAATYDGGMMKVYINGVLENAMAGPVAIAANAVNVGLGAQSDGTRKFNGAFDDVKIYNRALTESEVAALVGSGPPEADLGITKDDFVTSVTLGQAVTYHIEAVNFGPSGVVGAKVTDLMPSQLANVTWTCTAAGGATCSPAGSGSISDLVNMPAGGSLSYAVHGTVSLAASGAFMNNTATISASHISDPAPDNNSVTDSDQLPFLIDAHFASDVEAFTYVDDLFRATTQPSLASGAYGPGFDGGGLQVILGGVNGSNTAKISGGWRRSFSLANAAPVTVSFRYRLTTIKSRTDRFAQTLVSLDGVLRGVPPNDYVVQIPGGVNGATTTTDWQLVQIDLGVIPAGTHVIGLGGYLSRKSASSEFTEVLLDDVRVIADTAAPGGPVVVPPSIVTPPSSATVTEPGGADFSVVAAGDAPLSYQWRRNFVPIVGAAGASYLLTPTALSDSGARFDVIVTNPAGSVVSAPAFLTVNPAVMPPSITTPPANVTVTAPAPASFSVVADGTAPLDYQWRRSGVAIAGATGTSYVLNPTAVADSGAQFDVIVSNAAGSVVSSASMLTVNPAPVPPSITTPPASVTVTAPAAATFAVVASGGAPLSYQWRRNGIDIAGATSTSYILTPTSLADSGAAFSVVVSNGAGSVTSAAATLTVKALPGITTPPVNTTVTAPASAAFTVVATGTAPLTYQWRRNGVNIAGATSPLYVRTPTSVADSGSQFEVVVSNVVGSVTSPAATLTVLPTPVPPSITTQPANQTVTMPATATFSVVATGDAPLSYQWRRNGVDIAGATGASYAVNPTAMADNGASFSVVVSNAVGSVTSTSSTLTVYEGVSSAVLEAHFEGGADGFAYVDDLFRGTIQPTFANGTLLPAGGFTGDGLRVVVGGVNSSNVANMSGGWRRTVTMTSTGPATLTVRYKLSMVNSRTDRFGQMLISIDGTLVGVTPNSYVAQLAGTGGGGTSTTGWQSVQVNLGTLTAGSHTLALGGFLTRKSNATEFAEVLIDDVIMTVEQ